MERKKRSKGSVWEFCYANKIVGTFGVEMRSCGQKLVKFCTLTHPLTHAAKLVVRLAYTGLNIFCELCIFFSMWSILYTSYYVKRFGT